MIIERTEYYAKPGLAQQVLAIRRRASAIRREIGLAGGRIMVRRGDSEDPGPDVAWECEFSSTGAHVADLAARGASPKFEAIRAEMKASLARFARLVFEDDTTAIANGMRPVDLAGHAIVPRELTIPSAGRDLKAYFFTPPGPGPHPCLLLNHGSGIDKGTLDVSRPGTSALLMSWGIASVLLHRHGYGNSPGPGWREEVTAEHGTAEYDTQLAARLDRESDDVVTALAVLRAMKDIRADHIGVMGSSFGGINTLLAASKSDQFTCAIEFAGAAMNWDVTPGLRKLMTGAAGRLAMPILLIQAENDYSIRPTKELAEFLTGAGKVVFSRIYPSFGVNASEGHLLESRGPMVWTSEVHRFLERYL